MRKGRVIPRFRLLKPHKLSEIGENTYTVKERKKSHPAIKTKVV